MFWFQVALGFSAFFGIIILLDWLSTSPKDRENKATEKTFVTDAGVTMTRIGPLKCFLGLFLGCMIFGVFMEVLAYLFS